MKKLLTFLLAAILSIGIGWATETTITFSELGYDNAADLVTVTSDDVTLTFSKGSGSNAPKYYTSGSAARMYAGNTITVSSDYTITSIVFTYTGTKYTNLSLDDSSTGSYSLSSTTGTWTGSATSVGFTVSSGQARITKIVVTYGGGSTSTVTAPTASVEAGQVEYGTQVTLTADGTAGIYYTTDGTDPTESSDPIEYTGAITITGETTIKAVAYDSDMNFSDVVTYTYTVYPLTLTLTPASGTYTVGDDATVTVSTEHAYGDVMITYSIDGGTEQDYTDGITIPTTTAGTVTITVNAIDSRDGGETATATATYTIKEVGAANIYTKVTSADQLVAGNSYILVYEKTPAFMGAIGSYGASITGPTITDNTVDISEYEILEMTLGGKEGAWTFDTGDGAYLAWSSGNSLTTLTDATSTNAQWTATANSSGDYILKNVNTTGRVLQYNASSPRFACYTSSQGVACLYYKGGSIVTAPTISPEAGTVTAGTKVTITIPEGTTVYYSTDGTNYTAYTSDTEIVITKDATVYAYAEDADGNKSKTVSATYTIGVTAPTITPNGGTYEVGTAQDVTITADEGCTIYYSTDGENYSKYSEALSLTESTTIYAYAQDTYGNKSDVVSATFKFGEGNYANSVAEFNNNFAAGDTVIFKNPVTVLFDYSQSNSGYYQEYIWVKDRTGYAQFFIQPSFDTENQVPRYTNGDVIPAGFKVVRNYYENGGYYQGLSNDTTLANFQEATTTALADPELVTLTDLHNDYDNGEQGVYNNRYLRIEKIKITNKEAGATYYQSESFDFTEVDTDIKGEQTWNGNSHNIYGYNKFNKSPWKEKDGTTIGVRIPEVSDTAWNVTFIYQQWKNKSTEKMEWEMFPIKFEEWVDNTIRLDSLVAGGEEGKDYTISNQLYAAAVVWDDAQGKFAIFAKDDEMYAHKSVPTAGQESYLIDYNGNTTKQEDYDQSNWIEILLNDDLTSKTETTTKFAEGYMDQLDYYRKQYVGKILPEKSISGKYTDTLNPTIEVENNPTASTNSSYTQNIFCTANFLYDQLNVNGNTQGAPSGAGYNDLGREQRYFFMMDAKPQEFCKVVWAFYEGTDTGIDNYFVAPARENDAINGYDLDGSFLVDMSLCSEGIQIDGSTIITKESTAMNSYRPSSYYNPQKLYGYNAIVRKNPASDKWTSSNSSNAPRHLQAKGNATKETVPAYIVYPLEAESNSSDTVTGIEEILNSDSNKAVESVRYYNIMGMESAKPFEGVNIVVTRYTDGTSRTVKVMR